MTILNPNPSKNVFNVLFLLQGVSSLPSTPKTPKEPRPESVGAISPPPAVRPGMIKTTKGSAAAFSSQYAQYLASMVGKTSVIGDSSKGDETRTPMEGKRREQVEWLCLTPVGGSI